jgi:hypothetical protein
MHNADAIARQATSPLQVTAAAPFWRALRDESAIWMLTPLPPRRDMNARTPAFCGLENTNRRGPHV